MLNHIILLAIKRRWLIMILTLSMCLLGIYNFKKLPIDAVPDITNIQVQINTEAQGYSPLEVEQRVTFPIETVLAGIPRLEHTRSLSRYGLSQVTAIFEDGTDIYFARQLINEKLQQIRNKIPADLNPTMSPVSTGLGEIYFYTVEPKNDDVVKEDGSKYTLMDLLTLQKWIVAPKLRGVKGVIEINTIGGYEQQYHITPYMDRLLSYDLSVQDLLKAIERNNDNIGAGYIERNGEQYLIRIPGQVKNISDIENIILSKRDEVTVTVKNVADVKLGFPLRTGAATKDSKEVVLGTAMMLMGENSQAVVERLDSKIKEIANILPKGIIINTVYDRAVLVKKTINTVKYNLLEGALFVIVILLLFLGNIRAALITAAVIPISMLMTITGMVENKISANLMSLGALDFGLIVDGAVIIIENYIRRLGIEQHRLSRLLFKEERFELAASATSEVIKPSIFGIAIITIVYLPVFTLTGVEGKMFYPMAFTVVTALVSALVLCLTFIPAAVAIFIKRKVHEKEGIIIETIKSRYEPLLKYLLYKPIEVMSISIIFVLISILCAYNMGSEFVPALDEGDIAIQVIRAPGTSLNQSIKMQVLLEKELLKLPEIKTVISRIGTAEVATDAMPPNVADIYVLLKPKDKWPNSKKQKISLIQEIEHRLKNIPGNNYEFSQPIELRFNELISGVRSDLAVKVYGDDFEKLMGSAKKIEKVIKDTPGAADVKTEQVSGLPVLSIIPDNIKLHTYGLNISDVQQVVKIALGGETAGLLYVGDQSFDIVIRLSEKIRDNIDLLEQLPILLPNSDVKDSEHNPSYIPLKEVAKFKIDYGPAQISREHAKRKLVVTANVRGRDLGSFVQELQLSIPRDVKLPDGYWIEYGGTFEHMISAKNRLLIVVPIALLLIFMLLFMALNSIRSALVVFSGVPLALIGGILALLLRGIPLSISAGIGFIALSGVAVLNGVVMISFIQDLYDKGNPLDDSIIEGALTRLRPVIVTALVASLGFIPMAFNTGIGSEVQRPLATVVIGGIISSTILTLLVLPTLYRKIFNKKTSSDL